MARRIHRSAPKTRAPGAREAAAPAAGGGRRSRRVSARVVNDFTVQFATLSAAGIPIVRALTILEGQTRPGPFKNVLRELVEDVSAGTPVSEAMAKHEGCFDRLYAAMVRAGEAGGVLDQILERLAQYRERIAEIRGQIVSATVYPALIVVVAVAVVAAVIVLVIPKFQTIFDSFDVELPGPTRFLLDVSEVMKGYWYLVFGLPLLLFLVHLFLMGRRGRYRYVVHRVLLRIPLLGALLTQSLIAGFSRTFGTLLGAGVPHLDALTIVRDTSPNEVLVEGVAAIRRTVREGEGIARPMEATGVFDDLVCNMVEVGEQTGELDTMLLRVADAYERSLDRRIDLLFRVLQPAILIVVAGFVGFIVVALFLPLMRIMGTLNQP